jgi:hypothetical protein
MTKRTTLLPASPGRQAFPKLASRAIHLASLVPVEPGSKRLGSCFPSGLPERPEFLPARAGIAVCPVIVDEVVTAEAAVGGPFVAAFDAIRMPMVITDPRMGGRSD